MVTVKDDPLICQKCQKIIIMITEDTIFQDIVDEIRAHLLDHSIYEAMMPTVRPFGAFIVEGEIDMNDY